MSLGLYEGQELACVRVKDESGSSPCVDFASVPYTQQPKHACASAGNATVVHHSVLDLVSSRVWGLGFGWFAHDEDLQEAAQRVALRVRHQHQQPCPHERSLRSSKQCSPQSHAQPLGMFVGNAAEIVRATRFGWRGPLAQHGTDAGSGRARGLPECDAGASALCTQPRGTKRKSPAESAALNSVPFRAPS